MYMVTNLTQNGCKAHKKYICQRLIKHVCVDFHIKLLGQNVRGQDCLKPTGLGREISPI